MATDKPTRSSSRRDVHWDSSGGGPSSTANTQAGSPDAESSGSACTVRPFISAAADEIALAALRDRKDKPEHCDLCESPLDDEAGSGLLMWTRGEDRSFDEPPLCTACATAIGVTAWVRWTQGDDEYD
jgi:hypothetical protein